MSEQDTAKRVASHTGGVALCVFLCIYFFFPVLLIMPIAAVNGRGKPPPRAALIFFLPLIYLVEHVPPYGDLIMAEMKWMEKHWPGIM